MRRLVLLLFLASIAAAPVEAQASNAMCFVPGSTTPTPAGYTRARTVAQTLKAADEAQPPRFLSVDMVGGAPEQVSEVFLELMTLGVSPGLIFPASGASQGDDDCVDLRIVGDAPGEAPRMGLWHAPRLFFDPGQTELNALARRNVRYLLPGYEPRRTRFIIRAYTDTVGSVAANVRVSEARARSTARELIRWGVLESDIEVEAFGESRLHRATPDETSEPLNRTVGVDVRRRP